MPRFLKNKVVIVAVVLFVLINIIAFFHAYKFTHFSDSSEEKTNKPEELSAFDRITTLLLGVSNPRPANTMIPLQKFEIVELQSNKKIECWSIKTNNAKGTVILFHGYGGNKSLMLDRSDEFLAAGFNTFLVDFMGSGGSEGNQTTIGFKEAEEVKTAYDYVVGTGEKNICLFGSSLGAVAIMKAVNDYHIKPQNLILECPFSSMYSTTANRFRNMNVPPVPMAGLLVIWGGIQNGFWALGHKPVEYAKAITSRTLLLYGEKDKNVSRDEINSIFNNLQGDKEFKTYKDAGHENYLTKYREQWTRDVTGFLLK